MRKGNWIWMPHSGHFILGDKCRFVLNTYVGSYIVSTIGELWNDQAVRRIHASVHDDVYGTAWYEENQHLKGDNFDAAYMRQYGFDNLGAGERKYETMVFPAKKSSINCCPWVMVSGEDVDFRGYEDPKAARLGHMELCEKWATTDKKTTVIKQLPGQTSIEELLR
jgi:hypothetical protein